MGSEIVPPSSCHPLQEIHRGFRDAGKAGHAPYPKVYDRVVSLEGIRKYAQSRQLAILDEYGVDYVLPNFGSSPAWWERPCGRLRTYSEPAGAFAQNLGFVMRKPAVDTLEHP